MSPHILVAICFHECSGARDTASTPGTEYKVFGSVLQPMRPSLSMWMRTADEQE